MLVSIIASKGGVGKSTIASNLLVAARLQGIDAVGVDLDHQAGLKLWADIRQERERDPAVPILTGRLSGWREAVPDCPLAIVDTPPGLEGEDTVAAVRELATSSDLVLMPVPAEEHSVMLLGGPAKVLAEMNVPIVAVLNRVMRNAVILPEIRAFLAERAELCPIEVRLLVGFQKALGRGLGVIEDPRLGGDQDVAALWAFVAGRLGVA